jgi:hypothetical protein
VSCADDARHRSTSLRLIFFGDVVGICSCDRGVHDRVLRLVHDVESEFNRVDGVQFGCLRVMFCPFGSGFCAPCVGVGAYCFKPTSHRRSGVGPLGAGDVLGGRRAIIRRDNPGGDERPQRGPLR